MMPKLFAGLSIASASTEKEVAMDDRHRVDIAKRLAPRGDESRIAIDENDALGDHKVKYTLTGLSAHAASSHLLRRDGGRCRDVCHFSKNTFGGGTFGSVGFSESKSA
jgi:hypothetical protein